MKEAEESGEKVGKVETCYVRFSIVCYGIRPVLL